MASSMGGLKLLALVVAAAVAVTCMGVGVGAQGSGIACGTVVRNLMPCLSYVQSGGTVPAPCCRGINTLNGLAKTSSDRQGVCSCLKNAANGFSYNKRNLGLASGLPAKCGINLPYKISPSTDCESVK